MAARPTSGRRGGAQLYIRLEARHRSISQLGNITGGGPARQAPTRRTSDRLLNNQREHFDRRFWSRAPTETRGGIRLPSRCNPDLVSGGCHWAPAGTSLIPSPCKDRDTQPLSRDPQTLQSPSNNMRDARHNARDALWNNRSVPPSIDVRTRTKSTIYTQAAHVKSL